MVEKEAKSPEKTVANRIVYQLVRVEENGTVVPATKDEVIQMKTFLQEDIVAETPVVESSLVCINDHDLDVCEREDSFGTKDRNLIGSQHLDELEAERKKLIAQLEFLDAILQKLKDEEQQRACRGGVEDGGVCTKILEGRENHPPQQCLDSDQKKIFQVDKTFAAMDFMDDPHHLESPSSTSKQSWISITNASSVREKPKSQSQMEEKAKCSKGGASMDSLSIRELQEVFQATFGRQTSVKDKQWLKRRISLGSEGFSELAVHEVKDVVASAKKDQVMRGEEEHESMRLRTSPLIEVASPTIVQTKSLKRHFHQVGAYQSSSRCEDHMPSALENEDAKEHMLLIAERDGKRQRKPTKRYIEELPAVHHMKDSISKSFVKVYNQEGSGVELENKDLLIEAEEQTIAVHMDISKPKLRTGYRKPRDHPGKNGSIMLKGRSVRSKYGFLSINNDPLPSSPISSSSNTSTENGHACKDAMKRKHQHPWTLREVMKLVEGVTQCGVGKWADIKKIAFSHSVHRTSMDLKDKWRNLLRASSTHSQQARRGEHRRKHGSPSIPSPLLVRIRELAGQILKPVCDTAISKSGRVVPRRHFI